jgi:hypothetical protein
MADSFFVEYGKPLYDTPGQQAKIVVVDALRDGVIFLRKEEDGEDIEKIMEEAKKMRHLRKLTTRRLPKQPG